MLSACVSSNTLLSLYHLIFASFPFRMTLLQIELLRNHHPCNQSLLQNHGQELRMADIEYFLIREQLTLMFQGKSKIALEGARRVQEQMPLEMVKIFKLLEGFLAQPMYVMVRFGFWEKALEEPAPLKSFRFVTGVWQNKDCKGKCR